MQYIRQRLGANLGRPSRTLLGRYALNWMTKYNAYLERCAVEHLDISKDDHILEVGFGPGLGLEHVLNKVDGGKVYGVDISSSVHRKAEDKFSIEIAQQKLFLYETSAANIPLNSNTMDKAFHCNCFYFWPDIRAGCNELHRVLKPGSKLLTVQNMRRIIGLKKRGYLAHANIDFVAYMSTLEHVGFTNVRLEYCEDAVTSSPYQCIWATATDNSSQL